MLLVRGWVMYNFYKSPHKDRNMMMCVCVCFKNIIFQCLNKFKKL